MDLGALIAPLRGSDDPDLLVGLDTSDDAAVYRVREDLALVQTVDIITPVCDDPYLFGQVAAANALSDVFAMGGRPLTALNICCFPASGVPPGVYESILIGSRDKAREAGAVIAGGHSVRDNELKYGLSVTGLVHPDRILRNSTARAGDEIVLTKPIGTGVIINAARKGLAPDDLFRSSLDRMATLNQAASEEALAHGATACTDVTGFGLSGHLLEVVRASGVGAIIRFDALPRYEGAFDLIERGVTTAMTASNRAMAGGSIRFSPTLTETQRAILFDPQTSGGLLVAVPPGRGGTLVAALRARGVSDAALIGETFPSESPVIEVVPA